MNRGRARRATTRMKYTETGTAVRAHDAADDHVGAVAEHSRTEHVERRARDRDQEDDDEDGQLGREQTAQPTDRRPEVLRPLGRHARRVPPARGPGLGCREIWL